MKNISYLKILKRDWDIVGLIVGIAIVVALVASIIQPFKYEASTKLLVIQNQVSHLDAYTATKSAEKIGKNLSQVIASTAFYNDVVKLNPSIADEFPTDPIKLRKEWKEDVTASIVPETGILQVSVFHEDKQIASDMLQTINFALVNDSEQYHGGGASVSIQVIDDVFVGNFPARPNLIMNVVFAMIAGFVIGSVYIVLNEAQRVQKLASSTEDGETEDIQEDVYEVDPYIGNDPQLAPVASESFPETRNWQIIEEV